MLLHLFHLQKEKVLSELFMYVDNNQEQAILMGQKLHFPTLKLVIKYLKKDF